MTQTLANITQLLIKLQWEINRKDGEMRNIKEIFAGTQKQRDLVQAYDGHTGKNSVGDRLLWVELIIIKR